MPTRCAATGTTTCWQKPLATGSLPRRWARSPRRRECSRSDRITASYGERQTLFDISLAVQPQECLALVGESGSGKTTLARCIAGLHHDFTGELRLRGEHLAPGARARTLKMRQEIQYVFQSPYASLNPRRTVGQIVRQPLKLFFDFRRRETEARVLAVLERVALSPSIADRFPDQLSGRRAPARSDRPRARLQALALVCDEVTSALDVSVQAAIVQLLRALQQDMGLTMLFVHTQSATRALDRASCRGDERGPHRRNRPRGPGTRRARGRIHAEAAREYADARSRRVTLP